MENELGKRKRPTFLDAAREVHDHLHLVPLERYLVGYKSNRISSILGNRRCTVSTSAAAKSMEDYCYENESTDVTR
jgi:hypothetical protein